MPSDSFSTLLAITFFYNSINQFQSIFLSKDDKMTSKSIDIYPLIAHSGKFAPDSFGDEIDKICNEIHAATKGFGTNEKRLLKALGGCTADQRCKVPGRYFQLYNKDLNKVMESECGNRVFGTALQFLAVDPVHAECLMIEEACQGIGTKEMLLFSIICGRSNSEIELLKNKYKQVINKNLERRIGIELSGNMDTLAKWVLKGAEVEYNPQIHTNAKMEQDAEKLHSMGEGRFGTNENGIIQYLCTSPPKYVQGLNSKYEEKYGKSLVKAMEREMSGQLEKGIMVLLKMKLNPHEQIAKMIHDACGGIGTNELLLTCYLIRYQSVMKDVDQAHQRLYKKSIANLVKFETSGDYEKLLLEIVNA